MAFGQNASNNYRYESARGLNHRHSHSTTIIFQGQSSSLPFFSVLCSRPTAILETVVCARVWIMMVNDSNHLNGPLWTDLHDFLHGVTAQWTALQSIAELDYIYGAVVLQYRRNKYLTLQYEV